MNHSNSGSSLAKQYDQTNLYSYAFFPPGRNGLKNAVKDLASKVRKEDWGKDNVVLENYIKYLFRYIKTCHSKGEQTDRGLVVDATGSWSAMHTRLFTKNFEPIYAAFEKNRVANKQNWVFKFWSDKFELLKLRKFGEPPKPICFWSKPYELQFDPEIQLHYDVDHILHDDASHGRLQKTFPGKSDGELRIQLSGAIAQALRRVEQNSRTVIPQYYWGSGVQLLLPLCFGDDDTAQLVLPCQRESKPGIDDPDPLNASHWNYMVHTVLGMGMAYSNARLLNRLESEWLTEPRGLNIEASHDDDDDA